MFSRRSFLLLFLFALAGNSTAAPPALSLLPQEVAPGVYVVRGVSAEPDPANGGAVINSGFVVGLRGVVVIDSGPHRRYGEALLAAIRRVTAKPVKLVINTHPHPENVLGNGAFAQRGVPIVATARTRDLMELRCPVCITNLRARLGDEWMQGTQIVLPDQTIGASRHLRTGGRRLHLIPVGWAHTEGDLAVFDEASGVLFAGGLVYADEIPYTRESRIEGWVAALDVLRALPVRHVVPGHGPVGGPERLENTRRYLRGLLDIARTQLERGVDASGAAAADLPEFSGWALHAERHDLNVQHAFGELEEGMWRRVK